MPSPEAVELWRTLRAAPDPEDLELEEQRDADELVEDAASEPAGVRYDPAAPLEGLWATPESWDGRSTVLYLFGGGYVASSPATRRTLAGHLARAAGARVAVPDYRLAPEHPFPAALEDATDAYRWLITEAGVDPRTVAVAGDSAGGGLALATMLSVRGEGLPLPAGAVAISPWVDLALAGESLDAQADTDLTVTRADLERKAREYLDGADPRNPLASPLYGDLTGLPPLLVVVGADEALLDDSIRLVRKAGVAGVQTTLIIEPEMQHAFPIFAGRMPEADAAIAGIGEWIRRRLTPSA
ncbi:MAG: epsilon-lactone hydrolase [Solirubrobacteraceae bacterium]|nr:epsilon-lactone hydrolase [Solirubrobacteraceae bacterium]